MSIISAESAAFFCVIWRTFISSAESAGIQRIHLNIAPNMKNIWSEGIQWAAKELNMPYRRTVFSSSRHSPADRNGPLLADFTHDLISKRAVYGICKEVDISARSSHYFTCPGAGYRFHCRDLQQQAKEKGCPGKGQGVRLLRHVSCFVPVSDIPDPGNLSFSLTERKHRAQGNSRDMIFR
jgi:hypothetical protein